MASAFKLKIVSAAEAKPATLELRPDQLPAALRALPRWVGWHWLWRADKAGVGKWTKAPLNPNAAGHARANDPATWGTFEAALALMARGDADGIGFQLGDGWCGADFDDCRNPDTGEVRGDVRRWIQKLNSYAETSATGTGIKVIGRGTKPKGRCRRGGTELYDRGRFFAVTGWRLRGSPPDVSDITAVLAELHAEVAAPKRSVFVLRAEAAPAGPLGDDEVLAKARAAANAEKFKSLWAGDTGGHGGDDSAADLALCSLLAFWCGNDRAQVDRLFRRSGLMRPKWDERHRADGATYGRMTLELACSGPEVYDPGRASANGRASPGPKGDRPQTYTLTELLALELPPPRWAVPGLMGEGLTILAGKPKLGKSWMALNVALTIAGGGTALAMAKVVPGDVLYLSLEDRLRRVQDRARKLLAGVDCGPSGRLRVAVVWPKQNLGGLNYVREWMREVERPTLVVVDVWQKFRPALRQGSQYEQDYEAASQLKGIADDLGCSVLAVHHCKKAAAEDVVDEISGTLGLAGAADGLLVLTRSRGENEGRLFCTGRDIEEQELALQFDPVTFAWKSLGDARHRDMGKVKAAVLAVYRKSGGASYWPGEMAKLLEMNESTVRKEMWRMSLAGLLQKVGGKYEWPPSEAATTEAEAEAF